MIYKRSFNLLSKFQNSFIARMSHQGQGESIHLKYRRLVKPLAFTLTVCGSSFVVATVWSYEAQKSNLKYNTIFSNGNFKISKNKRTNDSFLSKIQQWWNLQNDGFKVFAGIAAINGVIFLGWKTPRLYPIMTRYFVSSIDSKSIRCLPMILSNFSHHSFFHLGLNMLVLYSFSNIGVYLYGKENFLALYFSSGVMSTFASYAYKIGINSITPSLGASGAILGILAATCIERPDIKLMIIFLPFFSFSSGAAIKGLILLDSLGLIMRWKLFDHAAHLGGTLFGAYYAYDLKNLINGQQSNVIKYWNEMKKKF